MKMKFFALMCAVCLLLSVSLAFSSCDFAENFGIVNAKINEKGELVLVYGNGTEQNLGTVVGQDGEDGADGTDGADGRDGEDGSLQISVDGNSIPAASAKGLRSAVSIVCNFQVNVRPNYTREATSAGSGVIYQMDKSEGDAFIITNYHVVYYSGSNTANGISDDISVYLYGSEIEEKAIEATYVGGSLYYDIAVLRVEDSEILKNSSACQVSVAESDQVVVGDQAIAIGNAQGLGISSTLGVVSVDSEHITMTAADGKTEVTFRVMRVDTAINSGNSGGGLYDSQGNLIGIVNAKIVYDGVESIGYAIPSGVAVSVAENIIDYCFGTDLERVQRAMLGITVIASDSKAVYNSETGMVTVEETVSVYEVSEDSLVKDVLAAGDVLVSVTRNGETLEITRQHHAIDMMLDVRAGDTVTLRILRNGETQTVSVTVTEDCLTEY